MLAIDTRIVPSGAFGEACCEALLEAVGGHERPCLGLATGATPVGLYEALRGRVAAGLNDIAGWRPFAIDEYVCRRDHGCANRAFFEHHWNPIPGAARVVQFDPEADDLNEEGPRFARLLRLAGGLDVSVLGIGTNGHLAFNEPGSARASRARLATLSPESRTSAGQCFDDVPYEGLTLGLSELLGARRVLLLANGAGKAEIVARALQLPVGPACPASFVREHPGAVVVLDEPAAAGLVR